MEGWCRAEKCIDKKRRLRLSRVYVYTKEAGIQVEKKGALHSVSDINAGDDINIYLIDGHARAVVSEVINDEQRK